MSSSRGLGQAPPVGHAKNALEVTSECGQGVCASLAGRSRWAAAALSRQMSADGGGAECGRSQRRAGECMQR
jgi:hypothetical protein